MLLQRNKEHRSDPDHVRGKARRKKKKRPDDNSQKKSKSKTSHKDPNHIRRRRIPKDLLDDDLHVIKSAEFINESDDESDDEKTKSF